MSPVISPSPALSRVPPELFRSIAALIPLNILPSTLLSLSLVDKLIYRKTKDLLYIRLVLRNEDAAISAFTVIQRYPSIGKLVKELYVLSERPHRNQEDLPSFKFLGNLRGIVAQNLLPNLSEIAIFNRSRRTSDHVPLSKVQEEYTLPTSFWNQLQSMAPRIQHVTVRNLANDFQSPWIDCEVIEKIAIRKDLRSFNLSVGEPDIAVASDSMKATLVKNVEHMQHTLRSLTLGPPDIYNQTKNTHLVSLTFDNLHSLELHGFDSCDSQKTVAFWLRHSVLEHITLWKCTGAWFEQQNASGLLPRLVVLKTQFRDVRALVPLLDQLTSLCIFDTYGMQVPYLLCHVTSTRMNNLRSLEIQQHSGSSWQDSLEGVSWRPTINGNGDEEPFSDTGSVFAQNRGYISLLIKTCPNIEELGFLGHHFYENDIVDNLGACFAELRNLKHIYFPSAYGDQPDQQLVELARQLAGRCSSLQSVTRLRKGMPPLVAWISRAPDFTVNDIAFKDRWGLEKSMYIDDPFPDTRPYIMSYDF